MTNKAVRKAVAQIAFVIGLVLTANAIRPISPVNLTLHTLAAARSFSFVLPAAAVERIENANYLAQVLGESFFDRDRDNSVWAKEAISAAGLKSGLLALNDSADSSEEAEIKDVTCGESAKKQSPAKRPNRRLKHEDPGNQEEVARSSSQSYKTADLPVLPPVVASFDTIAMAQPVNLPVIKSLSNNIRAIPASMKLPLSGLPSKLTSCPLIEVKEVKLIALIQQSPKMKVDVLTPQPATISLQCHEEEKVEKTEAEEATSAAGTATGPEEEFFFAQPNTTLFMTSGIPDRPRFP